MTKPQRVNLPSSTLLYQKALCEFCATLKHSLIFVSFPLDSVKVDRDLCLALIGRWTVLSFFDLQKKPLVICSRSHYLCILRVWFSMLTFLIIKEALCRDCMIASRLPPSQDCVSRVLLRRDYSG